VRAVVTGASGPAQRGATGGAGETCCRLERRRNVEEGAADAVTLSAVKTTPSQFYPPQS
jgi:hypothetical protein